MNTVEVHLMLMLVGSERNPVQEKHQTLHKNITMPFVPFPGLSLHLNSSYKANDSDRLYSKRFFPPTLMLNIEEHDVDYNVSKNELTVVWRKSFHRISDFDKAVEELVSDFGFR